MSSLIALTRDVSDSFAHCQLTHLDRQPIELERARHQHAAYQSCLAELGCTIQHLPARSDLPDAVFVEDTAVVLEELAMITRPGAPSRRAETQAVARALQAYLPVLWMQAPATLDGGDVLVLGKTLWVGSSTRTNQAGIEALREATAAHGYTVQVVALRSCLHLKTAVTRLGPELLLLNPDWIDPGLFGIPYLRVDPAEPMAANALLIGHTILYPSSFPGTARVLEQAGLRLRRVDVSELAKAEGGVTCCSLVFAPRPAKGPFNMGAQF